MNDSARPVTVLPEEKEGSSHEMSEMSVPPTRRNRFVHRRRACRPQELLGLRRALVGGRRSEAPPAQPPGSGCHHPTLSAATGSREDADRSCPADAGNMVAV